MPDVDSPAVRSVADRKVVAGWFDAHARALAGYATSRVGQSLGRDIVADTFRIALEQIDTYDRGRGGERAWLFGIASNLIRRHWRSEERRLRIQARSLRADPLPVDPLLRVDERLDASADYQRVVDAVGTLDPDDRDLLVLVAWEQLSSREAAEVLGVPPGTVRSRLARIRARLAQIVRQGDSDG
jgi:RNA polymerase sigma-70 factor (ECF subfamily)